MNSAASEQPQVGGKERFLPTPTDGMSLAEPPSNFGGVVLRVALLAVLYCLSGWAGLQLAQPPGYATPIWPPSGIMLALLLLWGNRVGAGIWLGSLAVNIWVGMAHADAINPNVLAIAACIATGSTAEGLVGASLVRRWVHAPRHLETGADVWRFVFLGGLVSSAIAASVGTATLGILGGLPRSEMAYNWLTWWVGDCMGVFLIAPLLLVWAGGNQPVWRRRLRTVGMTVALSVSVGAIVVAQTNRSEQRRISEGFAEQAQAIDRHLLQTLEQTIGAVATLADFVATSPSLDRARFDHFAAGVLKRAPGIEAVAWAPRVAAADRARYESETGAAGPGAIAEYDQGGQRQAAGTRAVYYPLQYIYPDTPGASAWNFDLGSERLRAETIEACVASGALRFTPRIDLHTGRGPGVDAFLPVSTPSSTGIVSAVIVFSRLMDHVLAAHQIADAVPSLVDVSDERQAVALYTPRTDINSMLHWQAEHELGGRRWRLSVDASPAYLLNRRSLQAWLTQVGVLFFSALLGGFLLVVTGRSARVELLVRERTGELRQRHAELSREVAERRAAEGRLLLSAAVFEHLGEAVMITDSRNRILQVNPAFTDITGYRSEEVIGRNPSILASGRHDDAFYRELWQGLKANGVWRGEVWDRRKDGTVFPEWLNLSLVRDAQGQITHHVAVFSDISERKAAEERMLFLAQMDALTNLPNRYLLSDRLHQAMELSRRTRQPFAVMFIDVDRFKKINDSLGHGVGDNLLKEVASRLSDAVRSSDTVARHGGDEFVIVMPGVEDAERVAHVAGNILKAVAKPYHIDQHLLNTTASIGIAMYPADAGDVESLMRHADAAMYEAKSAGRNLFRFFTQDMNRRVQQFLRVENELREALARNELRLHYQPQHDVNSGAIVGAEALVRWQHPQRGLVLPGEFIHVAEESGLIEAVGNWVLDEACRQNRAWQLSGLPAIPVAVNLSAAELHRGDMVTRVQRALAAAGLDAQWLELEVTESMVMKDSAHVGEVLQELREMGVMIALDDFGTGYSSLAHLRRFPLNALKVDRSFVRDLQADGNDAAICKAVIALGKSLGLKVVAEGVENADQLAFLRENRCDTVQGSLFSWGVPADEFARLLGASREATTFSPV